MKIGIQGLPGSFAEVAANTYFHEQEHEWVYLENSHNVCLALQDGQVARGVVAIENSIGGRVVETEDALSRIPCRIIDEVTIPIEQCLLVRNGILLCDITQVHSHPQALAQSAVFLKTHLPNATCVAAADTALCAQQLRDGDLPMNAAVIGNGACATLYGLTLLKKGTQLRDDNKTRFLIMVRPA